MIPFLETRLQAYLSPSLIPRVVLRGSKIWSLGLLGCRGPLHELTGMNCGLLVMPSRLWVNELDVRKGLHCQRDAESPEIELDPKNARPDLS